MAKYEKIVHGDFKEILDRLHRAVMDSSLSASFEDGSDFNDNGFQCSVRVYERYSAMGGNRVSMSMTLAGRDGSYCLCVITSGGSQGVFWKINTLGEESFLETVSGVIEQLS